MTRKSIALNEARAPDGMRLYAIGDVHGRLDLLWAMHRKIEGEIERDRPGDWRIIHLGDYVDRGTESRGVIDHLIEAQARDPRYIALAGNHDVAFLDFLSNPDPESLFVRFGGHATALSYGVDLRVDNTDTFLAGHGALMDAVPEPHKRFLQGLGFMASFGDYFFCHAGVRPGVALDQQSPDDLAWIRQQFLGHSGLYEKIVVHGHTPTGRAALLDNRINVDTGAYFSGLMSAVALDGAAKRVIEIEGAEDA